MFCQQNIINLLTKLVKKYVYHAHHPAFALFWHEMRLFCSVFSNLRSWQDFSILAPPLSDVKFSFLTLRRVEKKGIFFLHQTQKCGCYKILSSSSSFFDFLIIFVTNLQRVKCSSFFKRLQMNKTTRCFPKNCTFYDFTEKWVKKTLKMD